MHFEYKRAVPSSTRKFNRFGVFLQCLAVIEVDGSKVDV